MEAPRGDLRDYIAKLQKEKAVPSPEKEEAVPTASELASLRETEELYKSNLFRLEVMELLTERKIDYTRSRVVHSLLERISKALTTCKRFEVKFADVAKAQPALFSFLPAEFSAAFGDASIIFRKAARVATVGSFALQTVCRPRTNVDVAVEMPDEMFLEKDYLNYRYFVRRALYLAGLEQVVRKKLSSDIAAVRFERFGGDARKPILTLEPGNVKLPKNLASELPDDVAVTTLFVIRLFPVPAAGRFSRARLGPTRSNVRVGARAAGSSEKLAPTPGYNAAVLEDLAMEEDHAILAETAEAYPNFREAVVLLKSWMHRRNLDGPADGVNGYLLTVLLANLARRHVVLKTMSSYQMFRLAMKHIGEYGVVGEAFRGGLAPEGDSGSEALLSAFQSGYDCLVFNAAGDGNAFSRVSASAAAELREDARRSFDLLAGEAVDAFEHLFINPSPAFLKFDAFVRVARVPPPPAAWTAEQSAAAVLDCTWREYQTRRILGLLARAMQGRVTLLRAFPGVHGADDSGPIVVGVLLDPAGAWRTIVRGPSANDAQAVRDFRALWGPRCEKRHFRDGSVLECIVWEIEPARVHEMPSLICKHVLELHFPELGSSEVDLVASQLNEFVGPATRMFAVAGIVTEFNKELQELKELPLPVLGVRAVAPCLRWTDPFPPIPHPQAGWCDGTEALSTRERECLSAQLWPIDLLVEFEQSAGWPDTAQAIQAVKLAFCLKLGELLKKQHGYESMTTLSDLVVFRSGYALRLNISCPKELAVVDCGEGPRVELLRRDFISLPVLHGHIHALHSAQPLFGLTARLAKRFLSAHMFAGQFPEMVTELLVARVFLRPEPFGRPGSSFAGLARFLRLLATFDFGEAPVVVDFAGDLSREITDTAHGAVKERLARAGAAVAVVTCVDPEGTLWTRDGPSTEALTTVASYAEKALGVLERLVAGSGAGGVSWKALFRTPLAELDCVIPVNRDVLRATVIPPPGRRGGASVGALFEAGRAARELRRRGLARRTPPFLVDFDPMVLLLGQLQAELGRYATFHYDIYGGAVLGIRWRDLAFTAGRFSVTRAGYLRQLKDGSAVADCRLVLERVLELGRGMLQADYELNRDPAAV